MNIKVDDADDRPCTDAALTLSPANTGIVPHTDHAHALSHVPQSIIHATLWNRVIGDASTSSASQGIPLILWNSKTHYRHHNNSPPFTILSQMEQLFCVTGKLG
jgi:hypothetical protein